MASIDEAESSDRRGVMARVRKGGREYTVALADLEPVETTSQTAEWLAAYRYWLGDS